MSRKVEKDECSYDAIPITSDTKEVGGSQPPTRTLVDSGADGRGRVSRDFYELSETLAVKRVVIRDMPSSECGK